MFLSLKRLGICTGQLALNEDYCSANAFVELQQWHGMLATFQQQSVHPQVCMGVVLAMETTDARKGVNKCPPSQWFVSAIGTPELTKTFLIWIQPNSSSFIAPFLETTQYSLGPFLKWEYLDKALPSNILLRKGPEGNFCPYLHNMRYNYHSNLLLSALVLKWKRGWGGESKCKRRPGTLSFFPVRSCSNRASYGDQPIDASGAPEKNWL